MVVIDLKGRPLNASRTLNNFATLAKVNATPFSFNKPKPLEPADKEKLLNWALPDILARSGANPAKVIEIMNALKTKSTTPDQLEEPVRRLTFGVKTAIESNNNGK